MDERDQLGRLHHLLQHLLDGKVTTLLLDPEYGKGSQLVETQLQLLQERSKQDESERTAQRCSDIALRSAEVFALSIFVKCEEVAPPVRLVRGHVHDHPRILA